MKDLVLKKKTELEEHKRRAHLIGEDDCEAEFPVEAIEAGKNSLKISHVLATACKCIVKHFSKPHPCIYFFCAYCKTFFCPVYARNHLQVSVRKCNSTYPLELDIK